MDFDILGTFIRLGLELIAYLMFVFQTILYSQKRILQQCSNRLVDLNRNNTILASDFNLKMQKRTNDNIRLHF